MKKIGAALALLAVSFDASAAWTSIHGVEFRSTAVYVSTGANDVVLEGDGSQGLLHYPQSKSVNGDTFNVGWTGSGNPDGTRNRDTGVDVRLAGMQYLIGGTGTFQMQAGTAAGNYRLCAAFSDQTNGTGGTVTFTIADSNGTLTSQTGLAALSTTGVYDILGNLYASAAAWAAGADSAGDCTDVTTTDTTNGNGGPMFSVTTNGPLAYFSVQYLGAAYTQEQEGFRWGVDDGNEAAHTFEAAQDTNISIADTQSRLLRAIVNATNDPASLAYTLRYQKNGAGGYTAVPVGSTTATSITNQTVAASADDGQEVSGGTNTINGSTIGASLDSTAEWAGMRFTNITIPAGATITAATVGVVPSGTGEDEPLVTVYLENADDCAAFTTGASNISGRSRTTGVSWSSTDLSANGSTYFSTPSLVTDFQAVINRGGWASGNDVCVLIQGGATGTRDLTIEAYDLGPGTNPPRLSVTWTVPNEVYVTTSANITASGEATTARLTAPAGKTTSDFVTGRRWDDENGTDSIDITTDDYTEVEWLVALSSTPAVADYFDFRVYAAAAALDTYTVTPRWTIPGAGGTAVPAISSVLLAQ